MAKITSKAMNKLIIRKTIEGQLKATGKFNRRERRRMAKIESKRILGVKGEN